MNEAGEIVGMVDVLKLTYATLEQVSKPVLRLPNCIVHELANPAFD